MKLLKSHPLLSLLNSYLINSPQPVNISYLWNFGSLLGVCLIIQIIVFYFILESNYILASLRNLDINEVTHCLSVQGPLIFWTRVLTKNKKKDDTASSNFITKLKKKKIFILLNL